MKISDELREHLKKLGSKGGKKSAQRPDISEIRKRAAVTRARNKAALTKAAKQPRL